MSGHSKFKNIQHRKDIQDKKRSILHTKLIREIEIASREGGSNIDGNFRLRLALKNAAAANVTGKSIARAIARGSGSDDKRSIYYEVLYEGFASGVVALIIEAITDNKARTAAFVREAFSKYQGRLATTGSVSHCFRNVGCISYPAKYKEEKILSVALNVAALDVVTSAKGYDIIAARKDFYDISERLRIELGEPIFAKLIWQPLNLVNIDRNQLKAVIALRSYLLDNPDINEIYANYDVQEKLLKEVLLEHGV